MSGRAPPARPLNAGRDGRTLTLEEHHRDPGSNYKKNPFFNVTTTRGNQARDAPRSRRALAEPRSKQYYYNNYYLLPHGNLYPDVYVPRFQPWPILFISRPDLTEHSDMQFFQHDAGGWQLTHLTTTPKRRVSCYYQVSSIVGSGFELFESGKLLFVMLQYY